MYVCMYVCICIKIQLVCSSNKQYNQDIVKIYTNNFPGIFWMIGHENHVTCEQSEQLE